MVSIRPKYVLKRQKPYCCVPTCMQMILQRRRLSVLTQETIGIDLGLTVPAEAAHNFKNTPSGKQPPAGWGTRINLKKYSLNSFFKKRKIPLVCKYFRAERIKNVKKFITTNIKEGNDILICYAYGLLFSNRQQHGHANLIEGIHKDKITLVNPKRDKSKRVTVPRKQLVLAIVDHKKGKTPLGGFWVIHSANK